MNATSDLTLSKENPLLPAEDFDLLRRTGIGLIEKLASDNWTDYNTSDPGITILEAVCYAITDLAYRTGFDMADLLAPERITSDTWRNIFYTARQILPSAPLTITDYRALLIDIEGVRNAWIQPAKGYEVPVYVDYSYVSENGKSDCQCAEKEPCLGQLSTVQHDPVQRKRDITALLEKYKNEAALLTAQIDDPLNKKDKLKLKEKSAHLKVLIRSYETAMKYVGQSKVLEIEGLYNVTIAYEDSIRSEKEEEEVREQVLQRLHNHRNLGEDFLSVTSAEYADFSVSGLFVLNEDADDEEVLARICFEIYRFFSPSVRFYTVEQMQEKVNFDTGKLFAVEEIFEGPALKHGFVDYAELDATDLFRDFRLSDLINILSEVEGIQAISNLYLPFDALVNPLQDLDDVSVYFNEWIRLLKREGKVPRLELKGSFFTFLKSRETVSVDFRTAAPEQNRAVRRFKDLVAKDQHYKLKGHRTDFPVPSGAWMELEDYYPVQYSLPRCYQVGEWNELPAEPSSNADFQAYQLRAYLLFFEQILGDQHAQLNHLRELFSFDEHVDRTYFSRLPLGLQNIRQLLIDSDPAPDKTDEQFFTEFGSVLSQLTETKADFEVRRNTVLNHLLARFNENVSEYESLTSYLLGPQASAKLIADKCRLLQDYVKVSRNRGEGFNYTTPEQVWNTENVSGAERRIGRLLGFPSVKRRTLSTESIRIESIPSEKPGKDSAAKMRIVLEAGENEILLVSRPVNAEDCCIDATVSLMLDRASEKKNFYITGRVRSVSRSKTRKEQSGSFRVELQDSEGFIIAESAEMSARHECEELIVRIIELVTQIASNEGMHLIEHILLRPRLDTVLEYADRNPNDNRFPPAIPVSLPAICLDPCDLGKGLKQNTQRHPYQIKVSRLPADKCYRDEAWVVEVIRIEEIRESVHYQNAKDKPAVANVKLAAGKSILFREIGPNNKPTIPGLLSFRHYEMLQDRIADLRELGSDAGNYHLLRYTDDLPDASKKEDVLYYFEIRNPRTDDVLARSMYYQTIFEAETEIRHLVRYFGFELDMYCAEDICDHAEDPFSFRVTIALPCWTGRFRNLSYRHLVEKTIRTELPAHIAPSVKWLGIREMKRFEATYQAWLEEISNHPYPEYGPVNALVEILDTLRTCDACEQEKTCMDKESEVTDRWIA